VEEMLESTLRLLKGCMAKGHCKTLTFLLHALR
jgi:hypothetical protein